MFKKILPVIVIFAFLIQGNTITKSYNIKEPPQVDNGKMYLQGCHLRYTHFAPSVVEKPIILLLPKGEEAVSFDVEYSGKTVLAGEYDLKPILPGTRLDAPPPDRSFYERRSEVYNKNAFYPEEVRSKWFNTQYKNGHAIFYTSVNPAQYNPVTHKIQYYTNIKVTVYTQPKRNSPYYLCTPSIKSEIESMVHNPEAVADLTYTQQGREDYEYLIITPDALKNAWTEMVDFNAERCLRTKIETVQNISATGTGSDIQQKIRNYIKQEYEQSNITYVMLGADDNPSDQFDCASRIFGCKFWDHDQSSPSNLHEETDIAADMYYETLDGEWKNSGDPYYGAPGSQDMTWEVFLGRFPADNASHVSTMIDKTIAYSKTPASSGVTNLALGGNYAWTNNGVTVWGGDALDEHVGFSDHNGYETYGFPDNVWNVSKWYERDNGGEGSMTATKIRAFLKDSKPAFYIHDGHGNSDYVWTETGSGVTTSNYPQNSGDKGNHFIAISGACLPSNFNASSDCIMEKFAKLSTGIVASISNDQSGWGDNDGTDGSTHRVFRNIIDGLFNEEYQMHHLARIHARGKEAVTDIVLNTDLNTPPYFYCITYCIYETVLMGDPALSVWTATPQTFSESFSITNKVFNCDTKGPYTWVAICEPDGSILTTQLTGKDGICKIDNSILADYLTANPGVTLKVRVKAPNCLPFESDLQTSISNAVAGKTFNSFNSTGKAVRIKYILDAQGLVNISIFNSKGALVKTVFNGYQNIGTHTANFNNSELSNGIYYCRMIANNAKVVKKFAVTG